MKITDVEAISLFVPVPELTAPPFNVRHAREVGKVLYAGYRATIVRIRTDEGIVGVGECGSRMGAPATKAIVDELRPILLGKDPTAFDYLWDVTFAALQSAGHSKGVFVEAISGIDIACWDIAGKRAGRSIAALMGGPHRRTLRTYAGTLTLTDDRSELERKCAAFLERGHKIVKAKIGADAIDPEPELDVLRQLCERFRGQLQFIVDANCAYDLPVAMTVGRALEGLDVRWFEEPLAPDDRAGLTALARALRVPLAGGESEHTKYHFRDLLAAGHYAIIQPNVTRSGGLTECRKIAALAEAYHVPYAPHVGTSTAVCTAATLQLSAALPNFLIYELMGPGWSAKHPNVLRSQLVREPLDELEEGGVRVPDRPGLGITLNEDVLDRYRVA